MASGATGRDANDSSGDVLLVEEPDDCCFLFFDMIGEASQSDVDDFDDGNAPNRRSAAIEITFDRPLVLSLVPAFFVLSDLMLSPFSSFPAVTRLLW